MPSGVTIQSVFDRAGHRIAEYNGGTGALIRQYIWLEDRPLAVVEGGIVYLIRTDLIGRLSFATTMTGTVVWSASYLPFGGVNVSSGSPIDARFPPLSHMQACVDGQWASGSRPRPGFTRTGCATTIRQPGGIWRPTRSGWWSSAG